MPHAHKPMVDYQALVREARKGDWQQAVREVCGPEAVYPWSVDDHRAAAAFLALPATGGRALDTHCGRGTHVLALAGACRAVYACDPDPDAVRFVAIRSRQSGVENIVPVLGPADSAIQQGSLDLILTRGLPAEGPLSALVRLLRPGGRLCVGLGNTRSPLCRSEPGLDSTYPDLKSALDGAGLRLDSVYAALPNDRDVRVLLHTEDPRGLRRFLTERYPRIPLLGLFSNRLLRTFHPAIAPGYWAIAQKAPAGASKLEDSIREGLSPGSTSCDPIRLPIIYANRGTFTLPVFTDAGRQARAVLRMDAGRSRVLHEAAILRLISRQNDADLAPTIPKILWEGRIGSRGASLQTAMGGRPLPFPRSPRLLERQLHRLCDWVAALYRLPVDSGGPHSCPATQSGPLYESRESLLEHVAAGLADRFWNALDDLRQAGLRPSLTHGDLHPGNILTRGRDLAFLDWEYAGLSWAPFDWFHHVGSVLLDRTRKARSPEVALETLQDAFARDGVWLRAISRPSCLLLNKMGIDTELFPQFCTVGAFDFLRRRFGIEGLHDFQPFFSEEALAGDLDK